MIIMILMVIMLIMIIQAKSYNNNYYFNTFKFKR